MSMKRRHFLQTTAAAAGVLGLPLLHTARAQAGPVRIGVMLPMSGIGAEAGAAWLAGAKVAAEQWNAKGGVLGFTRALATELGLRDRLEMPGWIEPGDVPQLLNEASVVVMPSRREESRR